MADFNLKKYVYDKYVEGVSTARVAESLGITVEELNNMLNEIGRVDIKADVKKFVPEENKNIEKLEKEEIPVELENKKPKKKKKAEEDASWMND